MDNPNKNNNYYDKNPSLKRNLTCLSSIQYRKKGLLFYFLHLSIQNSIHFIIPLKILLFL